MPPRPVTYAGVGSRETPEELLSLMELIGKSFANRGFKLRTGDALGADAAFIKGALEKLKPEDVVKLIEAYMPSMKAAGSYPPYMRRPDPDLLPRLSKIVDEVHPAPYFLKGYGRSLQERNALQVLGPRLDDPIDFLIGALKPVHLRKKPNETGGTGQAYRLAQKHNIPVFDLLPTTPREDLTKALQLYVRRRGEDEGATALSKMLEHIDKMRQTGSVAVQGQSEEAMREALRQLARAKLGGRAPQVLTAEEARKRATQGRMKPYS